MIVVFTGGTGGSKLVQGLQHVLASGESGSPTRAAFAGDGIRELTVIVNTGDDIEWWGLHISPDIDSVLYGLAGLLSKDRGWGLEDDSFRCLERMKQLGEPGWFSLGDLDLATHLTRTALLRSGKSLSQTTAELAQKFGVRARLLPMSDQRVSTMLETSKGRLTFQEYFVRERHQVEVQEVCFEGADQARPAPGVIDCIQNADAIIFAPSNPVTSIGPILAVPGIREALRTTAAPVAAVSPIVGGAAVSGPAAQLMQMKGWPSTITGVAKAYEDFLDILVADLTDEEAVSTQQSAFSASRSHTGEQNLSPIVLCTNTIMHTLDDKQKLAAFLLEACAVPQSTKA